MLLLRRDPLRLTAGHTLQCGLRHAFTHSTFVTSTAMSHTLIRFTGVCINYLNMCLLRLTKDVYFGSRFWLIVLYTLFPL